MPRAAAGGDFLESINELFQEISQSGFSSRDEDEDKDKDKAATPFVHVRDQLVTLLQMVSKTTAARARANCPVTLPDGREPETRIQLPPATFQIEDTLAQRLLLVREPVEFIGVLAEAFEKNRVAQREDRLSRPAKRKRKSQVVSSTPRKKIIIKTKTPVVAVVSQGGVVTPVSQTSLSQIIDKSIFATPLATPLIKMRIEKGDKAIMSPSDFVKRATQTITPRSQKDIVGRSEELGEAWSSPASSPSMAGGKNDENDDDYAEGVDDAEDVDNGTDEDFTSDHESDDAMSVDSPYKSQRRTAKPSSPASEASSNSDGMVDSAARLQGIMDDVSRTTAEEWELYRPKLLKSLEPYAVMEYARLCSLGPTESKDSISRLDAAIAHLSNEIAVISPPKWNLYNRKLHRLCSSDQFLSYDFCQRLWKVMDLMYLDEETQAISTGEWDRLETVAKIVATICEAVGPEEERAERLAEQWFCSKVKDIRFLKRVTASLERKNELLHSMDGVEQ